MTDPQSPIRVAISDQFQIDGISVTMGVRIDNQTVQVTHFTEDGSTVIETSDFYAEIRPTFRITHDFARALLDALLRYYQGSGDYHTLRADYLHERERVDKMIGTLQHIASREPGRT